MIKIKIKTSAALILAAALLTGCGNSNGTSPTTAEKTAEAKQNVSPKETTEGEITHEVTLEVQGTGQAQVYYNLSTNKMETVTLPWKKTETMTLTTDAEKASGLSVSVVPGSVEGADGFLRPAPCVITVDGKKVADNQGGKSNTMCEYSEN
jgi:major membrane immunogen (membrane-anchored lipoprotein)